MIQVIESESFGSQLGKNLGSGLSQGVEEHFQRKYKKESEEKAFERIKQQLELQNQLRKETERELQTEKYGFEKELLGQKDKGKIDLLKQLGLFPNEDESMGQQLQGGNQQSQGMNMSQDSSMEMPDQQMGQPDQKKSLSQRLNPDQIAAVSLLNPQLGKVLQDQVKAEQKQFEGERSYNSEYTKKAHEKADQLRESIPRKEMALNFARNAVETGDLSFFSPDKIADITGLDIFRTAKGAQLATASKENLLSNMGRVSARAQNIWFEQRLNSMFPKIGQSKEANLTVQEMLEGEVAMDNAYLQEYDRLVEEDTKKYGFEKKDVEKRARDAVKPIEKEILARTGYRMKEIEEQEKGLSSLKKEVGKNVSPGTPLTLAMAKLYKEKFGDDALAIAKKNGYKIPSLEEFQTYRSSPQQSREME